MTDRTDAHVDDVEHRVEPTVASSRRLALLHDVLLFCVAFTGGALFYAIVRLLAEDDPALWGIGLSDELVLSGLVAGELFVLWNNGLRQGLRGHSVGKHRVGLRVVDPGTGRAVGAWRGLARGVVVVVLLDLAFAAVPIGIPTVLRRATPESWHVGGAAYVALLLLLVPLVLPLGRDVADLLSRSRVVRATGPGAVTDATHLRALVALDVVGVVGVLVLAVLYIGFYGSLLGHVPPLW